MLAIVSTLGAIDLNLPPDAGSLASSGITILNNNPSSVFSLPSVGAPGYESSIIYLYSDQNLPLYSLFAGHPMLGGVFVAGSQVLNHPFYNENNVLLNYHWNWNVLQIGLNERFLSASVKNGTHSQSWVSDVGIGLKSTAFETSIAYHNLFHAEYQEMVLPEIYLVEMVYHPVKNVDISIGCEKQKGYDASIRLATKYDFSSALHLVAGYQYQPDRFSGGLEFTVKRWQLCYAVQTHPDLDLTHGISISWK